MPAASRIRAREHTPMSHSLAAIRSGLFVSILSDCLDLAGVTEQALPCRIRPLDEASIMVGRARTAQFMEVEGHASLSNPYELEIALIDSLRRDEIPCSPAPTPHAWHPGASYCRRRLRCGERLGL
jgi:hypothetical protein